MAETKKEYIDYLSCEIWKVATGYQYYLVSNFGRVYSMKHNKILKCNVTYNGYLTVRLKQNDGAFKHIKIHRLVAQAFVENPDNKKIVHHIDCNNQNNNADNLMWVTDREHKEIHRKLKENKMKGGAVNE